LAALVVINSGAPPSVSSFSINNGSLSWNVTLNNVASNSPTQYMASESPSFSGASWQTYSSAPTFTLSSGNGVKTVYFKVRNSYGNSSAVSDTITLSLYFDENCSNWDTGRWSSLWTSPSASNDTWVFNFPAGWTGRMQANHIDFTDYGTYEVKLKTSGPRVNGTNWWIFLYNAPNGYHAPLHQELDFAEISGSHPIVSEYSLSLWVNGKTVDQEGIGYWYIDIYDKYGINFEDGNFHAFKYNYSSDDLIIYIDDIQIFKWSTDCVNKTALGLPIPPMQFMIGGDGDGPSKSDWSLIVDYIKYYA
jgi:hypothetical protein